MYGQAKVTAFALPLRSGQGGGTLAALGAASRHINDDVTRKSRYGTPVGSIIGGYMRRIVWVSVVVAVGCGGGGNSPDMAGMSGSDLSAAGQDGGAGDMGQTVDMPQAIDMTQVVVPDGMVHLTGSAAKGPFISGVNVDVQSLNSTTLNPIAGTEVSGQTSDNAGEFSLDVVPGLSQIHVNGQFYQEIAGTVSSAAQDLYAIVNLGATGTQSATVNLVTHLTSTRIKSLITSGMTYAAAVTQAENELRAALKVGGATFDPGVPGAQMSFLDGDTVPSAYLFAMSSTFDREAMIAGQATSLQEQINTVEQDLQSNGTIDSTTTGLLNRAQACVRPSDAMTKLRNRFTTIQSTATVPNINRALDSDLDGTPNITDTCLRVSNASQTVPAAQVCDSTIDTSAPTTTAIATVHVTRTADLNGDSMADLIVIGQAPQNGGSTDEVVVVWLGQAGGTFGTPLSPVSLATKLSATHGLLLLQARLGDLNGDNHPDLVLSYALYNAMGAGGFPQLSYLPGDASGGFGSVVSLSAPVDPLLCGSQYCMQGQVCSAGTCTADCRTNGCGNAGTCNASTGVCACGNGPACSMMGGTPYCVSGACATSPACTSTSCSNGSTCDATSGQCKCGNNGACNGGAECISGTCYSNCPTQACPGGYTCGGGGMCQVNCGAGSCGMGQVCQGATCVQDCRQHGMGCSGTGACDPNTGLCKCGASAACGTGSYCVSGMCGNVQPCSSNGGTPGTTMCNNGDSCDDSTGLCYCGTVGTSCAGQCSSGQCRSSCGNNNYCNPGEACSGGTTCMCGGIAGCSGNSVCVTGACHTVCGSTYCGAGQICDNDNCIAQPYLGLVDFDLVDVDGDSKLDIVGTMWGGVFNGMINQWTWPSSRQARIGVLRNQGGSFASPVVTLVSSGTDFDAVQLEIGDFDGTHHADVAVALRYYDDGTHVETWEMAVLLNDGNGNFAQPANPTAALTTQWTGRTVPRLGDVDGDGYLDLVVLDGAAWSFGNPTAQTAHIFYGDHTGHFATPSTFDVSAGQGGGYGFQTSSPYSYTDCADARPNAITFYSGGGELGLGDLNGDGKADILAEDAVFLSATGRGFGSPGRIEGLGTANASSKTNGMVFDYLGLDESAPLVADLDNDSKAEVTIVSTTFSGSGNSTVYTTTPWVGRVNPAGVHTW